MFGSDNKYKCDCVYEENGTTVECLRDAVIRINDTSYCKRCASKAEQVDWL